MIKCVPFANVRLTFYLPFLLYIKQIVVMMRYRFGFQAFRRFSTDTLPERNAELPNTRLSRTEKELSALRLSEVMEKNFDRQIKNYQSQNSRAMAEFNSALQLNFAEEENGRTPILQSYTSPSFKMWFPLNILSWSGFSFGLISGTFSFYTLGGIAAISIILSKRALAERIVLKTRKIVEINLLSDGQIEVKHSKSGLAKSKTESSIMDPKDFKYGISNITPSIDLVISQGKKYLIAGQTQVNNHLLNRIL